MGRGGLASDRRLLAGAVHTPGEIRAETGGGTDRAGLQTFAAPAAKGGHGDGGRLLFQGGGDSSGGRIGGSGGDTLPSGYSMVVVDGAQGDGVGMAGVGLGERTREG